MSMKRKLSWGMNSCLNFSESIHSGDIYLISFTERLSSFQKVVSFLIKCLGSLEGTLQFSIHSKELLSFLLTIMAHVNELS